MAGAERVTAARAGGGMFPGLAMGVILSATVVGAWLLVSQLRTRPRSVAPSDESVTEPASPERSFPIHSSWTSGTATHRLPGARAPEAKAADARETFVREIVTSGPAQSWAPTASTAIETALNGLPASIRGRLHVGPVRCAATACIVDMTLDDDGAYQAVADLFVRRTDESLRSWPGWIQSSQTVLLDGGRKSLTWALKKPVDAAETAEIGRKIHERELAR